MPVEQHLDRAVHPVAVHPPAQLERQLDEVGIGIRAGEFGLEEQPGLQRRQGPHRSEIRVRVLELLDRLLVEVHQRHVRRGQTAGVRGAGRARELPARRTPQVAEI